MMAKKRKMNEGGRGRVRRDTGHLIEAEVVFAELIEAEVVHLLEARASLEKLLYLPRCLIKISMKSNPLLKEMESALEDHHM